MHCLWCLEEMNNQISWSDVFIMRKPAGLCDQCMSELQFLTGPRCPVCSRMFDSGLCTDCKKWKSHPGGDSLSFNHSIFSYNAFMKEMVVKWKYRGDYILGEVFRPFVEKAFLEIFKKEKNLIAVPIPLSEERLHVRGFNQANLLASFLPVKKEALLKRVDGEKQAKKRRQERIATKNPFLLEEKVKIPVLLVDDIYTTGTTLRHAAKLLRDNECPHVYALTLIRG